LPEPWLFCRISFELLSGLHGWHEAFGCVRMILVVSDLPTGFALQPGGRAARNEARVGSGQRDGIRKSVEMGSM